MDATLPVTSAPAVSAYGSLWVQHPWDESLDATRNEPCMTMCNQAAIAGDDLTSQPGQHCLDVAEDDPQLLQVS